MVEAGAKQKDMAKFFEISVPTLRKKVEYLKARTGLLLDVKESENLRITSIKESLLSKMEKDMVNYDPDQTIRAVSVLGKLEEKIGEDKEEKLQGLVDLIAKAEKRGMSKKMGDVLKKEAALEEASQTAILMAPKDYERMPQL